MYHLFCIRSSWKSGIFINNFLDVEKNVKFGTYDAENLPNIVKCLETNFSKNKYKNLSRKNIWGNFNPPPLSK